MLNHDKLTNRCRIFTGAALLALSLGGCGGGGDNAGTCFGSDEVCGAGRGTTTGGAGLATGTPPATPASGNENDLRNLTCASFSTPAAAQAALAAGATQLDSDGDGIACNPSSS